MRSTTNTKQSSVTDGKNAPFVCVCVRDQKYAVRMKRRKLFFEISGTCAEFKHSLSRENIPCKLGYLIEILAEVFCLESVSLFRESSRATLKGNLQPPKDDLRSLLLDLE
jgi:hypothetical protein